MHETREGGGRLAGGGKAGGRLKGGNVLELALKSPRGADAAHIQYDGYIVHRQWRVNYVF